MAAAAKPAPSGNRRSLVQRFTGKVGPLPVWAWALLILVAGYLVYRVTAGSSTSGTTQAADSSSADTTTGVGNETSSSSPPASGQGSSADNLNDSILSQVSGLPGQIDALTSLIQSTPAFDGTDGSAGSGATTPNDGTPGPQGPPGPPGPAARPPSPVVRPPAPAPRAPAHIHYYTYKPGKAPKGREREQAPARGPAGTSLHFAQRKGYYYA